MRELAVFRTGPDGSLILALDDAAGDYAYEELDVELNGKTIEITTPDGEQPVRLEAVHGSVE